MDIDIHLADLWRHRREITSKSDGKVDMLIDSTKTAICLRYEKRKIADETKVDATAGRSAN